MIEFELKVFINSVVVNSLLCSFPNKTPIHSTFWCIFCDKEIRLHVCVIKRMHFVSFAPISSVSQVLANLET